MERVRFLIVGGGIAGVTAAETLRRLDADARIVILSKEDHLLYSRVLLPHYIRAQVVREKVFLRKKEQYEAKHIEVFYGAEAKKIRPSDHELELADGTVFQYEKLLLATGATPVSLTVPGADLEGIAPFRSLEDADQICKYLSEASDGLIKNGGVIGAGFISLEFPPLYQKYGWTTHMFIRGPRFWWRALDLQASELIESTLTENGVHLYKESDVVACEGSKRIERVRLEKGNTVDISFLGYGIGLTGAPNFVLSSGIGGGKQGIAADAFLKTNAPDVWVAGDCAFFEDVVVGRTHRLGTWQHAQEQARYVAESMLAEKTTPYENVSAYSAQIFDLSISFVGDTVSQPDSTWITRGSGKQLGKIHVRNGRIVGAALFNSGHERGALTQLIKNKVLISGKEGELADVRTNLTTLL